MDSCLDSCARTNVFQTFSVFLFLASSRLKTLLIFFRTRSNTSILVLVPTRLMSRENWRNYRLGFEKIFVRLLDGSAANGRDDTRLIKEKKDRDFETITNSLRVLHSAHTRK